MRLLRLKALGGFFLAAILSSPAWGVSSPQPGTVNYFEGHAQIGVHPLTSKSIGSIALHRGQSLTTEKGRAEVLLTPGVFLRVGKNSSVKMASPDLANTVVRLTKGHAMAEVDEIHKSNDIRVLEDGASIRLLKTGLYDFDVPQGQVRVFKGQALVRENTRHVKVGGGHEVLLNTTGKLKSRNFHKKQYEGSLYRFSKLRSDYLAEANTNASQLYASYGGYGPGWYGGWSWDPWLNGFTFMPAAGAFYSPFGFGFYPPYAYGGFEHFRDFDEHPGVAIAPGHAFAGDHPGAAAIGQGRRDLDDHANFAHGVGPHPGFPMARPPVAAFHAAPAAMPHMGGFARGPAMGAIHPGGFAFHSGGFHGDADDAIHR